MVQVILFYFVLIVTIFIIVIHISLWGGVILNRVRDLIILRWIKRYREEKLRGILVEGGGSEFKDLSISVVIAVRNEERNLPALIDSLENQTYKNFEIVFINDRSEDKTAEILEAFVKKHPERVKVVTNSTEPVDSNPKQFALDLGVREAKGDILLFTDADCSLPSEWVEYHRYYYMNKSDKKGKRVGLVFGQVMVRNNGSFLEKYQTFDQMLIHQYNSGSSGLGIPTGCFGNNLSMRKDILDEIGGFTALGYTLTEDAAMLERVGKMKKWKIRVSTLKETIVKPAAQENWKDFLNQHVRWNRGGFYSTDLLSGISYGFIVLYLVFSILVFPVGLFWGFLMMMPVTSFVFPGLLGFTAGLMYMENKRDFLIWFVPNMLFFMLFYSVATILALFKIPVEWKGVKL